MHLDTLCIELFFLTVKWLVIWFQDTGCIPLTLHAFCPLWSALECLSHSWKICYYYVHIWHKILYCTDCLPYASICTLGGSRVSHSLPYSCCALSIGMMLQPASVSTSHSVFEMLAFLNCECQTGQICTWSPLVDMWCTVAVVLRPLTVTLDCAVPSLVRKYGIVYSWADCWSERLIDWEFLPALPDVWPHPLGCFYTGVYDTFSTLDHCTLIGVCCAWCHHDWAGLWGRCYFESLHYVYCLCNCLSPKVRSASLMIKVTDVI